LFASQGGSYQESVLPANVDLRLAVEAGSTLGWEHWVGARGRVIGVNKFGASAPYKTLYEKYGLTVANIVAQAQQMLGFVE
jgi:transketolase